MPKIVAMVLTPLFPRRSAVDLDQFATHDLEAAQVGYALNQSADGGVGLDGDPGPA